MEIIKDRGWSIIIWKLSELSYRLELPEDLEGSP